MKIINSVVILFCEQFFEIVSCHRTMAGTLSYCKQALTNHMLVFTSCRGIEILSVDSDKDF